MFQKSPRELLRQTEYRYYIFILCLPVFRHWLKAEWVWGRKCPEANAASGREINPLSTLVSLPFPREGDPIESFGKLLVSMSKGAPFRSQIPVHSWLCWPSQAGGSSKSLGRVSETECIALHSGTPGTEGQGQSPSIFGSWKILKEGWKTQSGE